MKKDLFVGVVALLGLIWIVALVLDREEIKEDANDQIRSEISDSKASVQTNSETNNWETFINEKYKYSVKFPHGILAENISEDGYIIDFRFPIRTIRVYSSKNSRNDKTLNELIETRNHVGMSIYAGNDDYVEKVINGRQVFQYRSSFPDEKVGYYISVNTLILGKDYYYQISAILPVGDEQYSKAEKVYDLFLNTFTLDPLQ